MREYIKESLGKKSTFKEYALYNKKPVYIKDSLPEHVDINYVLQKIENLIPEPLTYLIDSIIVGELNVFKEKHFNAMYKDGAIYVSNIQDDNEDMVDDIIHEIAHAVEELAGNEIYEDRKVESEFLGKRKRLYHTLEAEGFKASEQQFLNTEYDPEFDEFLYITVGYPILTSLTMGLFISPYAVTSLHEYFARGFEEYFLKDPNYIRKISPQLFVKLEHLINNIQGEI